MINKNCSDATCPDISQCQDPWKVSYNGEAVFVSNMTVDPHIKITCQGNNPVCHSLELLSDLPFFLDLCFSLSIFLQVLAQSGLDCPEDSFVCDNKNCVNRNETCNGIDDCGDFSDETGCKGTISKRISKVV